MLTAEKDVIGQWLVERLGEIVGSSTKISWDDSFADLGLSSSEAAALTGDFERWLGVELSVTLFYDYASIREVVEYVSMSADRAAQRSFPARSTALSAQEPIAIVGMSCRFPGARDLSEFWQLLSSGKDAISEVPSERWDLDSVYDPVVGTPGKMNTRHGGFIPGIEEFDAAAFGIAPREAERMDPQQRAMLEIAWEAFEDAGLNRQSVRGTQTGVFIGLSNQEYRDRQFSDRCSIDAYVGTGNSASIAANRISYFFDLRGPSLSIDTACSSSLTAIHMACQSLRSGESRTALVGAVNLMLTPEFTIIFSQAGLLSSDGRCRTFDADASGYVRGEGAAAIVLKPYSRARADGDRIYGLIRGSAINQDGRTLALTTPNRAAQEAMLIAAYEAAGISPADVDYVEAHGTATPIGDVIEVAALSSVLQQGRPADRKCLIGSVKTNLGHLEAAAGMAGVIKTVLAMKYRQIPASLNFERPNPHIGFEKTAVEVVKTLTPWPATSRSPLAGVSAFGFGGTNAHVVLEAAPAAPEKDDGAVFRAFPVSARTASGLERACHILEGSLQDEDAQLRRNLAYTLTKRESYAHRAVAIADAHRAAGYVLAQTENLLAPNALPTFVFAGVGDHYLGMGQGLYQAEPVFRHWVDYCCGWLKNELDLDLLDVFQTRPHREVNAGDAFRRMVAEERNIGVLARTELAQPAVFVLEYAMARLLETWGVAPGACVGYSLGEYTAATLAGVFSLEDGLRVVATRARLIGELPAGAMLAVPLGAQALGEYLGGDQDLAIGVVNGPRLSVVSGPQAAIEVVQKKLQVQGVVSRRLGASHAFHSPMMQPVAGALLDLIGRMRLSAPRIPVLSNVTGDWLGDDEATSSAYWVRHLCETVQFGDCLKKLFAQESGSLIEIGPGQSLSSLARLHPGFNRSKHLVVATCRSAFDLQEDQAVFLKSLGELWCAGGSVNWETPFKDDPGSHVFLPSWLFDRQRYWIDPEVREVSFASHLMTQAEKSPLADSFYVPAWKSAGVVDGALTAPASIAGTCWLIFADEDGIGEALARVVQGLGIETVLVRRAEGFALGTDGSLAIRAAVQEDYVAVLKELKRRGLTPDRIVHLWAAEQWEADLAEHVQEQLERGFYSLFHLAQALGERLADTALELCMVASDLEPVLGTERIHPAKATLRGPCKVIRQEYATVACRSIDLFSSDEARLEAEQLGSRLAAEILSGSADQFSAFRDGKRWIPVAEPVRIDAPQDEVPRLKEGGVYFITGGLGGIGFAFAEYVYRTLRAKLVLVGRSGLPPREQWEGILAAGQDDRVTERVRKLTGLIEAGAEVLIITADVVDQAQMEDAVREALDRFGMINGVFHAAGLPGQGLIQLKTPQVAAEVMAPKIQGTLALDRALAGVDLDFMVLVSSIAAITGGGPGQIDYCAANAFLDAFAQRHRRKHGLTVSINFGEWQWDAWSDGLKGYQPEIQEALRNHRRQFGITFEEGMEGIRRILALDVPQMILLPEDAVAMIRGSNTCALATISNAMQQTRGRRQAAYPRPTLATQFVAASNELERTIAGIWQKVLGISQIGTKDNFFDLGGNSLVGLQVVAALRKELDIELRQVVLYEAPTIEALVQLLSPAQPQADQGEVQLLRERRENVRTGRTAHDVAIIGMAGRFPGARSPKELWKNISHGVESVTFYTEAELLEAGVSAAKLRNPNYVRAGYDVENFDLFDAMLFGYAPREAEFIDPQHRQFLECAWEALEDAACDPERYKGMIGIFAGSNSSAYLQNLLSRPDLLDSPIAGLQVGVGNSNDSLATRVAYKLNLRGPAMSVQTFCSTSGVAMHLACKSLLHGECDIAMAGGVNIAISGKAGYLFEDGSIDSPDGHTRTFDVDSKGAVIGDGVGVVVFKRLKDALADGDHIYAVVKGSAVNNDGSFKVGYTAPSVEGQAAVIAEALLAADVDADSISFVETHGTATELGDPIEVAALSKAYRGSTDRVAYCALGSIKPNIGHLDRAAGVTGLIKASLSLQHELITPVLHFKAPNPNIDFTGSPFFVADKAIAWPRGESVRRAGVNVLGLGGTNVHFILEEAPELEASASPRSSQLLLLSAKTAHSLEQAAIRLGAHLHEHPSQSLADVAYTLQTGRKRLEFRLAVIARDTIEAATVLAQGDSSRMLSGHLPATSKRTAVFLFPGVGDHYQDMAVDLYRQEAVFREEVNHCCEVLEPIIGLDLRTVLFTAEGLAGKARAKLDLKALLKRGKQGPQAGDNLQQTWLAQPCVFVIEYCLAHLLMSWGIMPRALLGYSLGEYVAATVAGSLSLEDALRVVALRAKLIDTLPSGSMLAVPLPEEEARGLLGDALSVAICSSPKMTVVSGPTAAIETLEAQLGERQVMTRRLQTTHAFHSSMMEPAREALRELLSGITLNAPQIPYLSNLTGTWIEATQVTSPDYWLSHLCQTVRFADSVGELLQDKERVLIEVGAGQSLGSFIKQHPSHGKDVAPVVSVLRAVYQEQDDEDYLQGLLGRLWIAGIEPDWSAYYRGERRLKLSLPTYAFDQQRYWVEPGKRHVLNEEQETLDTGKAIDMARWFYRPVWRESSCRPSKTPGGERWLIFLDEVGYAAGMLPGLRPFASEIVVVAAGSAFRRLDDTHFEIRPAHAEDYDRLIRSLQHEHRLPSRIAHCFSVNVFDASADLDDPATQSSILDRGYYSLLCLVQAFGKRNLLDPLDIVVVSSQMQPVLDEDLLEPAKSTLLGPCRGIPQESPHILLRSLDIPNCVAGAAIDEGVVKALLGELLSQPLEPTVAYRGGIRYAQDYTQLDVQALAPEETPLREEGVYLITGGLGGVGLILAAHLARKVRARLVLLGRTGLPARASWTSWLEEHGQDDPISIKICKVQALEECGAQVLVMAVDVADPVQLRAAVQMAEERFGGLHGVVHAAGISDRWAFRTVQEVARDDSAHQFRPKMQGLAALRQVLHGRSLDFCLLTSSLSAVLGGMTLIPYAAANMYMDAFTRRHNRTAATPWISVNWDTWRLHEGQHATVGKTVLEFEMSPTEGAEAFERLIYRRPGDVVVESTGSLQARLEQWVRGPFKRRCSDATATPKTQYYARPALLTTFAPTTNDAEDRIAKVWQRVLGIEEIGIHDNYFDLGGTSLSAIQLVSELQRELNTPVSPIVIFEAPTVAELAKRLNPAPEQAKEATLKSSIAQRKAVKPRAGAANDIAIIGMSGRFPGARTIDEFWENLVNGVESLHRFSDEELLKAGVPRAVFQDPRYVRMRPVVADADLFDAGFFGFSPLEAQITDPQHRILLEVAWEALEGAGYDTQRYDGQIGVFAGSNVYNYAQNIARDPRLSELFERHESALSNQADSLTTTISYKLNLRGPSYCIQTFCSTSMVAIHVACQNILAGECSMALAGGISLRVPQARGYLPEEGGLESVDGHSRSFDARASGTVFGDGVGMVLLKRLEDALADGDVIHAVIKGSAINNDGAMKAGYSAPSVEGQAEAIALALAAAGVEADSIDYVEASGTATELGDPIEVASLTRAFRGSSEREQYCALGSIKPNVGHPDRAAGVLGLIKTVEAMKHEQLPPTLFFEAANPKIDFERSPFFVNTQLRPWQKNATPRRAGVNSVGAGGTNAHIILEEAPARPVSESGRPTKLVLLSARTASALEAATANLLRYLQRHPQLDLDDVAYTLQVGRRHFLHRRAVVCDTREALLATLADAQAQGALTGVADGRRRSLGLLLPHEGEWDADMGAELYQTEPAFREHMDACCEMFEPLLDVDLFHLLAQPAEQSLASLPVQHALAFANAYAMTRLLAAWGVLPHAIFGDGVGAILAGMLSGCFALTDALSLVHARAEWLQGKCNDAALLKRLKDIDLRAPACACMVSTSDAFITGEQATQPAFWLAELTSAGESSPVRKSFLGIKDRSFLSLSPAPQNHPSQVLYALPAAHGTMSAPTVLLRALASLHLAGSEIDWAGFHAYARRQRVLLPTYPFERERYWIDTDYRAVHEQQMAKPPRAAAQVDIDQCLHAFCWKQSPLLGDALPIDVRWIVFADPSSLSRSVVAALRQSGAEPYCIVKGAALKANPDGSHTVNPAHAEDLEYLLRQAVAGHTGPCRIVDLWSTAVNAARDQSHPERIEAMLAQLAILKMVDGAITHACIGHDCRVLRVTTGAASVTGEEAFDAERALLLVDDTPGVGLPCRILDVVLPVAGSDAEADLTHNVLAEALCEGPDHAAAIRGVRRWVLQLEPVLLPSGVARTPAMRPKGTYLVVDGLCPIGLTLAYQLACRGAERLVITHPWQLPPREQWDACLADNLDENEIAQSIWLIRVIEELGCKVQVAVADKAQPDDIQGVLNHLLRDNGTLSGAFYVARDLPSSISPEEAGAHGIGEERLRMQGLAVLAEILRGTAIDLVVLLAAADSAGGSPSQGRHKLLEAYQGALAAQSSRRRRVVSIACNGWGDVSSARWEHIADLVWRIVESGLNQVQVDTKALTPVPVAVAAQAKSDDIPLKRHARPNLDRLYVAPGDPLQQQLSAVWQELLGIDQVGVEDDFFELGGHSLLGTRLFARINQEFGIGLQLRSVFESPTIAGQAALIRAVLGMPMEGGAELAGEMLEGEI